MPIVIVLVGLAALFFIMQRKSSPTTDSSNNGGQVIDANSPYPSWTETDVEALSRMIASENPTTSKLSYDQNRTIQTAIVWTAINQANRRGISPGQLVMPGGVPSGQNTGGRYASTAKPANDDYRNLVRSILGGYVTDPTSGAVQFDSPRSQRAALQRGVSGYTKSPEQVAASRISEGKEQVNLPGIDPEYMRWWRYA